MKNGSIKHLNSSTARSALSREQKVAEAKVKLTKAFCRLRTQGFIAKQQFSCCRSCAWCELGMELTKKIDKAPAFADQIKGAVFYTRQDGEALGQHGRWEAGLYLSFGSVKTEKYGSAGLQTIEIGKKVCAALAEVGLDFGWNGTEYTAICVKLLPDLEAAAADRANGA